MVYGSVCSGIEAASVAWHPLGWRASFLSEIEPFARSVLEHHHRQSPIHGDFTTIGEFDYEPVDVLVGGTPCQSFSVSGMRQGIADPRGNLMLEFGRLASRLNPKWIVWENVPGVLSSNGGRDFGSLLGMLAELGYGFAYRVLDAKNFGLPQSRKRVFVVGCRGDSARAARVLFKRESSVWSNPPHGESWPEAKTRALSRIASGGSVFGCLVKGAQKYHNLSNQEAFSGSYHLIEGGRIRNPTLTELCRLQGFPDNYLDPWSGSYWRCAGALGNSMAVPVMQWIGEGIRDNG